MGGNTEQFSFHLNKARAHGLLETEIIEVITRLAFCVGWPRAVFAIRVGREVFKT
jgi:4-carboxymuconolactone decarboxylase